MMHFRLYIIALLCLCSRAAMSQSHDFEIRGFHENMKDLTAATSNIKDLNGVPTALIRFTVRDTLFSFQANLGIVRLKNAVGEVLLYVPKGTKRITIRHPQLGIMRDYELPLTIESKTTYDAEIVITNADYLRQMYGYEQRPVEVAPVVKEDDKPVEVVQPIQPKEEEPKPVIKEHKSPPKLRVILGAGYNAFSIKGLDFSAGIQIGHFMLSADYTAGMEKVEGVGIYQTETSAVKQLSEAYDYSASRFSLRIGACPSAEKAFQIIPQVGVSFNSIKGNEIINTQGLNTHFSKSNPLSILIAFNIRIRIYKPLYIYATPQYDILLGKDDVYKVIKESDQRIKNWGNVLGLNAGLMVCF